MYYRAAQLQLRLDTCLHLWHHKKISLRSVAHLHGPCLHVTYNMHVTCNLTWEHMCKLLYTHGTNMCTLTRI